MTKLRPWLDLGRGPFLLRFLGSGLLAGVASWALTFVLAPLFGAPPPDMETLVWAVLMGGVVGLVVGLILWIYWSRPGGPRGPAP